MEERQNIPQISAAPEQGLTAGQVGERTAGGWVSGAARPSGKTEKEIVLTHTFTFFNLIFVILAVMLVVGRSTVMNMGFLMVAGINTVIGIVQEIS